MSKSIDKIHSLLKLLPDKDAKLGSKYLEERNFERLKELIDSNIIITKKALIKETTEYVNSSIGDLDKLKYEVDTYISKQIETSKEDIFDDYYECNSEEDYYEDII